MKTIVKTSKSLEKLKSLLKDNRPLWTIGYIGEGVYSVWTDKKPNEVTMRCYIGTAKGLIDTVTTIIKGGA